ILGEGVARIHKDRDGKLVGRIADLYRIPVKLTVLGIPPDGSGLSVDNKAERPYWVVDDSRTKVYQYDSQSVYVPFDIVQQDLGMDEKNGEPARTSEIDIRIKPGTDLNHTREEIEKVCDAVVIEKAREGIVGSFGGFN